MRNTLGVKTQLTRGSPGIVTTVYPYPGYCNKGISVPRVLWHGAYRSHGRTELPEVPGRYNNVVPVPRVQGSPSEAG